MNKTVWKEQHHQGKTVKSTYKNHSIACNEVVTIPNDDEYFQTLRKQQDQESKLSGLEANRQHSSQAYRAQHP